tara:strand:- start:165 stop:1310 length:1146 start_codon:yes stop_codon:yes gene_type:complete
MLMDKYFLALFSLLLLSCNSTNNPIELIIKKREPKLKSIYKNKENHNLQILYTKVVRDSSGAPTFIEYDYKVDNNFYFYPASTMKLPIVVLTLQKINELRNEGLNISVENKILLVNEDQKIKETTFKDLIAKVFLVSDNSASNILINFLGYNYFNQEMRKKGLNTIVLNHKFNPDPYVKNDWTIYTLDGDLISKDEVQEVIEHNSLDNLRQGKSQILNNEKIDSPFNFKTKNRASLRDLDGVMKRIIYPELFREKDRMNLRDQDYNFLRYWMSRFTFEDAGLEYQKDSKYFDSYNKFFIYGDSTNTIDRKIRIYNKVGIAYGTLTDISYIKDYQKDIEFFLSATLYVNQNQIVNDNLYEYDDVGIPFLAELARQVYKLEEQ